VSNHQIRNFLQMSAASRDQGNFYVANNCIIAMKRLSAPNYDIYQSQLKLGLSKATAELDRIAKTDTLIEAITSYEEYSVSVTRSLRCSSTPLALYKGYGPGYSLIGFD
jgi:DNA-dependent protein kinase catalytic subunit